MKNPYIIFLDFDGPLFSNRALMLPENHEYAQSNLEELKLNPLVTYWYADPVAIAMLVQLYRHRPYQLVISNAWGSLHNKEQIEGLLKRNGLGIPLHSSWNLPEGENKLAQIRNWLDINKYSDYMIIDDTRSGEDFLNLSNLNEYDLIKEKIVIVSMDDGIAYSDYFKMKAILATGS